jgi:adenylate cyclase
MERKLAAILAADVVGYSRLMQQEEADTFERLRAHRKELFEPEIATHLGRVFKLMGDGLLAEFGSVVEAVACADVLQREMAARNAGLPEDRRIDVRIGVHVGDVIVEGEDRLGDAVNIAARLQQLAEPGGICVSQQVVDHVTHKVAFGFESRGQEQLKNIAEPIAVYRLVAGDNGALGKTKSVTPRAARRRRSLAIAASAAVALAAGGLLYFRPWTPDVEPAAAERLAFPLPDKPSVAVLPLANLTGDPSRDFLVDGITDSIITELSRDRALFVIARNSTFAYKGQSVKIAKVAEDFGVRYVLEGSVQGDANKLRINARLVDAMSGWSAWSASLDGDPKDVLGLQDSVTRSIVATLRGYNGALQTAELHRAAKKSDLDLDAYENLLRGMTHKEKFTKEEMAIARKYFERAVEISPQAAESYGWLAWTYFFDAYMGWSSDPDESLKKAFEAGQKCVDLDPELDYGHWVLGSTYLAAGQIDRSLAEYNRALELNPNNSDVLVTMAWDLVFAGQSDKAIENVKMAMRLNPLYPEWYWWGLGIAYYGAGRFQDAADALERMHDQNSESLAYLAASYGALGKLDTAKARAKAIMALEPDFTIEKFSRRLVAAEPKFREDLLSRLALAELPPK